MDTQLTKPTSQPALHYIFVRPAGSTSCFLWYQCGQEFVKHLAPGVYVHSGCISSFEYAEEYARQNAEAFSSVISVQELQELGGDELVEYCRDNCKSVHLDISPLS